jgi:hypothetical protein
VRARSVYFRDSAFPASSPFLLAPKLRRIAALSWTSIARFTLVSSLFANALPGALRLKVNVRICIHFETAKSTVLEPTVRGLHYSPVEFFFLAVIPFRMLKDRKSRFAARIRSEPRMRPAHGSRSPQIAAGGGIWRITSRWYAFRRSLRRTAIFLIANARLGNSLTHRKISCYKFLIANGLRFLIPKFVPELVRAGHFRRSWPEVRSFASKVRNRGMHRPTGSCPPRGSEVCSARTPGNILARDTFHTIAFSLSHKLVESFLRPVPWLIAGMGESREAARF